MSSSIGKPNVSKPAPAGKKPAGDKKPAGPPAAVVAEAKKVKGDAPKAAAALAKAFATPDDAAFWLLSEVADAKLAPWILANYAAVLEACGSKKGPVKAAAKAALAACVPVLPAEAAPLELPCLFKAMAVEQQWPERVAALERLTALCALAPKQVAACLPGVVPEVTPCLWDTKKEVAAAAKAAMTACFGLCGNRDVEPVLPKLISAAVRPKEVPDPSTRPRSPSSCRCCRARSAGAGATALKRQAALIICNMSKLVDDARDAAPFLPKLLPGLVKLADEMSDPEAREVCERSVELMKRLEAKCSGLAKGAEVETKVAEAFGAKISGAAAGDAAVAKAYVLDVCNALASRRCFAGAEWAKAPKAVGWCLPGGEAAAAAAMDAAAAMMVVEEEEEEEDTAEQLCDCKFTLAYGTKILLHNTQMKLKRGHKYGLLGGNDCGKTTLMRSIANGQLEGFPPADEVKTVFACGASSREDVSAIMLKVGFSKKMLTDAVTTLSGGWRMKLALARAMLQDADILLMDEPTNHLDVMNVKWVKDYIKGLTNVTAIMVSHDSGLLNDVCNHILEIKDLKLSCFRGNLSAFVKVHPEARAYFELKSNKLKFSFPKPGPIEGVKSKGKALIKVVDVSFKYPTSEKNIIEKATVQVSLSSRVACVGPNGAGKSTLIKNLTGEVEPCTGTVWAHPNARIGYIAQHAFHHIESHLNKTPNEYIRWRYAGGDDKEAIAKDTMQLSEKEEAAQKQQIEYVRKTNKSTKENDYEVQWKAPYDGEDHKVYFGLKKLIKYGWEKAAKKVDVKVAQAASGMFRPLTQANVETHLKNVGLEAEFATHHRISALSGGQKVKVVLGAAMWMQPHIVILDEPTNYLDRESLGALADAIRDFEGGVVIISHNNDFTTALCPETWVVEKDEDGISRPNCQGDPEWMKNALATKCDDQHAITEVTDQFGNVSEVKQKKTLSKKEVKNMIKKVKDMIKKGLELDEDEEAFAEEHELWK
ncbi:protein kinase regulator [Aureococcus anophagefferens]|nr:protein kinase regulator [Aureococcus anophagefferens]